MAIVFLGIGSNMGDREAHIRKALGHLSQHEDMDLLDISFFIETEAEGGVPQGDFYNGVAQIKTDLLPLDLLSQLKMIERYCGRVKSPRNSPRPMDLDILFYDDVVIIEGKTLCIPHPRLADRWFVLAPLLDIAPGLVHPRLKKSVRELHDLQPYEIIPDLPSA